MGYWVQVSGQIRLAEDDEEAAFEAIKGALWRGMDLDGPVDTFEDLVRIMGNTIPHREADTVRLTPDLHGDPKWWGRTTEFFISLSRWVTEGRIDVVGEDGEHWSYDYTPDGLVQKGRNGWDGTTSPGPVPQADHSAHMRERLVEHLLSKRKRRVQ